MARFYGAVGYTNDEEVAVDVYVEKPIERMYKGELLRHNRNLQKGIGLNDDVLLTNQISILADAYANNHMHTIRYVKWRGTAWKVSGVEAQPPRLILTLGGVYNGPIAE